MSRDFVLAWSGRSFLIEKATFLMDKDLLRRAKSVMEEERRNSQRWDAEYGPQWIWDWYCERHLEKYGVPFGPNVNPRWDCPADRPPSQDLPAQAP